jgi:hypothetical protein
MTYTENDIDGIAYDGAAALESNDMEGVMESLALFSAVLHFPNPPKVFRSVHHEVRGEVGQGASGALRLGPGFIYDRMHNTLKYIESADDLEHYLQILHGDAAPDAEGVEVFKRPKALVRERKPVLTEAV